MWLLLGLCWLASCAEISERSCEDLALVGDWSVFGSSFVCGASKVGGCASACCPDDRGQTWIQAQSLCTRAGMRLCSAFELSANEAKGTGCGADVVNVWSADECSPTHARAQCGSADCVDVLPPICTPKSSSLQTRCCADARSPCRTRPCGVATNLCSPFSATTYTCSCSPPYLPAPGLQSCLTSSVCKNSACATDREALNKCLDLRNGTFTCICASGWTLGKDGRSCEPPSDPCTRNPCQRNSVSRNVCNSFSNGTYTCTCDPIGWVLTRSYDRLLDTCVEVPTICQNNTSCNYNLDLMNMCVDLRDGTYACECRGAQWKPSRNRLSCIKKQCTIADPCNTFQDPSNTCRENGESYNCTCNPRYWVHDVGRERCLPTRDPCDDDPCKTQDSGGRNVCVNNYNGSYACSCNGERYKVALRANLPTCMYFPDMCVAKNYPCSELLDSGNKCEDQMDGRTYKCICRGRGYLQGPDNQTCIAIPSACADHPCGENIVGGNVCNDRRDGTYTCSCNTRGWRLNVVNDLQVCVPPGNPCTMNDPCQTSQAGNMCFDRKDSTYYCVCNARAWLTPFGSQSCIPPATSGPTKARPYVNECLRGDPCSRYMDPANACIDLSNIPSSPFAYRCECHVSRGWTQGTNDTRCVPPVNKCRTLNNPCNTTANPLNHCVDLHDATYECSCQGQAWRTGPGKQSCLPPVNMCGVVNDFCKTALNPENICIDLGAATYKCICNARGFIATSNNQFCKEPSNPCIGKPCGPPNANVCFPGVGDSFTCSCRTTGWTNAAGNRRCIPPPNPCLYHDPCKTFQNRYNTCGDNGDGTYSCTCSGRGWSAALPDSQSCIPPENACRPPNRTRFDPCLNLVHPRNYCVDNEDGTYRCVCKAPLYTTGLAAQSCICPDPCAVSDPCLTSEESANSCYIKFNNTVQLSSPMSCYWHGCTCGNGWRLFVDSEQNERCVPPDPCLVDRCSSKADPLNECVSVYQPPSTIFQVVDSQSVDYPVFNPQRSNFPISSAPITFQGPSNAFSGPFLNSGFSAPFPNYGFFRETPTATSVPATAATRPVLTTSHTDIPVTLPTKATKKAKGTPLRPPPPSAAIASRSAPVGTPSLSSSPPSGASRPTKPLATLALSPPTSAPKPAPKTMINPSISVERAPIIVPASKTASTVVTARRTGPPIEAAPPPGRRTLGVLKPSSGPKVLPGAYVCKCNAVGWTTPVGARYCEMPNPCDLEDPCSSKRDPDNICYPGRADRSTIPTTAKLGTFVQDYYCVCKGRGWYTPTGAQFCDRCPNPCWSNGDACASLVEADNTCSWDFEGFFEAADALLQPVFNSYIAPGVPADAVFASQFIGVTSPNPWVANYFTRSDGNPYNDYWTPFSNLGPANPLLGLREGSNGTSIDWSERNISKADVRKTPRDVKFEAPMRRQSESAYVTHTSQTLGPRNVPAGSCGSYTCLCNGEDWRAPVTGKYCTLCPNPCLDDPCNNALDEKNVCTYFNGPDVSAPNNLNPDNTDLKTEETISNPFTGRRLMQASASLWPQDYLTGNSNNQPYPTSAAFDPNYRDPSVCGKASCQCDGVGWMVSLNGDSCVSCPDPCSNDPCQSFYDADNTCVSSINTPDFYTAYFGTDTGFNLQDLLATLNPAIGTGNKDCVAYVCVCGGENFAAGPLRQTCERCVDPCTNLLDPCMTSRSPDNFCINVNKQMAVSTTTRRLLQSPATTTPATTPLAPSFPRRPKVSSEAPTVRVRPGGKKKGGSSSPLAPTNQAASRGVLPQSPANSSANRQANSNEPAPRSVLNDLVNGMLNSRLQTILTNSFGTPAFSSVNPKPTFSQAINPDTGQPITQFCGKNSCTCDGIAWQLSPDTTRCEPICSNKCALADPCDSLIEPNNRCTFTPSTKSNTCGYYICTCFTGWRPTFGQQGCMQLPQNACQKAGTDPCAGLVDGVLTGNLCILDDAEDAGYRCSCVGDWSLEDNICVLSSALSTRQRARQNRKSNLGDDYGTDAPTTRPPANPCAGHDNCMVYLHPANSCVRSGPTSYQCKCNQPGYSASSTFSRCVPR